LDRGAGDFDFVTYVFGILAIALLTYAALHDVAARTVPNWLPLCVLVLGCAARVADHTIITALIIAAVTFAVLFAIWVFGLMGGGDVKLWAATALLIPPQLQPELDFYLRVFLLGGLLGIIYLALWPVVRWARRAGASRVSASGGPARRPAGLLRRVARAEAWRIGRRGPLPYACAISASAIFALLPPSLQL
jgi:prepilin peptidase CpaA